MLLIVGNKIRNIVIGVILVFIVLVFFVLLVIVCVGVVVLILLGMIVVFNVSKDSRFVLLLIIIVV